jgi:hypothetical protein
VCLSAGAEVVDRRRWQLLFFRASSWEREREMHTLAHTHATRRRNQFQSEKQIKRSVSGPSPPRKIYCAQCGVCLRSLCSARSLVNLPLYPITTHTQQRILWRRCSAHCSSRRLSSPVFLRDYYVRLVYIYMFSITPMATAKNATGIKHDLSLDSMFFPFAV